MREKEESGMCRLEYWGVSSKISELAFLSPLPVLLQVPLGLSQEASQLRPAWPQSHLPQRKLKYLRELIGMTSESREGTSGECVPSPKWQPPHSSSGFLPRENEGTAIARSFGFSKAAQNPAFYVCYPDF